MAEETFECDVCGRTFPKEEMKEFFDDDGKRLELCAEDLDTKMNAAGLVRGGPGEEKRAAAYAADAPQDGPYGDRLPPDQR
jgi:uncharacterized protein (DUF2225 family)